MRRRATDGACTPGSRSTVRTGKESRTAQVWEVSMEIKNTIGQMNPYQTQLDNNRADQTGQAARAARSARSENSAGGEAQAPKGDTISLSPEARLRTEAYSAAMSAPDTRQSRIDALKSGIASGEYQPDSRQIAGKLLAEEPGLFE